MTSVARVAVAQRATRCRKMCISRNAPAPRSRMYKPAFSSERLFALAQQRSGGRAIDHGVNRRKLGSFSPMFLFRDPAENDHLGGQDLRLSEFVPPSERRCQCPVDGVSQLLV